MEQSTVFGAIVLGGLAVFGYARMFSGSRNTKQLKKIFHSSTIVDVRTAEEYRDGHFSGALNIPVEKIPKSAKRLGNKNTPIIVYCATGSRSRHAMRMLKAMGYYKIFTGGSLAQMNRLFSCLF